MKLLRIITTLALSCMCLAAHANETLTVYFIGNSLTMSTTLDRVHQLAAQQGIDLQFGSQISGGKSLFRHLNYTTEPNQKWKSWETNVPSGNTFLPDKNMYVDEAGEKVRFGLFETALKDHKWDKVVFQLYGGCLSEDLKAISAFIDLALKHQSSNSFYIYSTWPNRPKTKGGDGDRVTGNLDYAVEWEKIYTASADDTSKEAFRNYNTRSYVNILMSQLKAKYPTQKIYLMPVGEIIYALNKQIKAGALPGIEALAKRNPKMVPGLDSDTTLADGANVFYADAIHFNPIPHQENSLGIFVSGSSVLTGLTGKSPVGLSGVAYGLDDRIDAQLIRAIQETIWNTYTAEPLSGIKGK